jgi:hypothetical protein
MDERSFEELSNEEFRELLDRMGDDKATDLPAPVFFEALGTIGNTPPQVELPRSGRICNPARSMTGDLQSPIPGWRKE